MDKKEHSPQAIRLKRFIDETGLTHTEFGRQCGFTSPRAMQSIYTDGTIPTAKSLNKIIARFPQLNYDWVLMGYGEMITKPFVTDPSTDSITKSTKSSFNQINKKLSQNDLAVNDLRLDVAAIIKNTEQNLLIYTQSMAILTNKVEQMSLSLIEAKKEEDIRIERLDKERKKIMQEGYKSLIEILKSELDNNHIKSEKMVGDFDAERKKVNRKRFEQQTEEILTCLANGKKSQAKLMNEKIDKGIIMVNDAMHKNAINQTEYAINYLTEKFSPKKLFPKIGQLTKNKKA